MADHDNHPDVRRLDQQANTTRTWINAAREDARMGGLLSPIHTLISSLQEGEYEADGVNIKVVSTKSDWHEQRTERGDKGYDTHGKRVTISELIDGRLSQTGELELSVTRGTASMRFNGQKIAEGDIPAIEALLVKIGAIQANGPVSREVKDNRSGAADILARIDN